MNTYDGETRTSRPAQYPRPARAEPGHPASRDDCGAMAIRLLHRALAIAHAATRRGERQYAAALRNDAPAVAAAALALARDARVHTRRIGDRIGALGGETEVTDLTPEAAAAPDPAAPCLPDSLPAVLCAHLMAERDAINGYSEIASLFESVDPTTRDLLESMAADAVQRTRQLSDLLARVTRS